MIEMPLQIFVVCVVISILIGFIFASALEMRSDRLERERERKNRRW